MIGLERGTVRLLPYDPQWATLGRMHGDRIERALGLPSCRVMHVGSTSVPGLCAKPIIDMAVGVDHLDGGLVQAMELAGYLHRPDFDAESRMLFVQADGEWRSAHIHVVKYMSMEWRNYLNFKHYLIAFPKVREEYAALKSELARQFPSDRQAYTEAKADHIRHLLRKAMVWSYLGQQIEAVVDRPVGYLHVKGEKRLRYPINYGYIPGVLGGDGEELDVYYLGNRQPLQAFSGRVIAIVHRADDVEDKLVAAPEGMAFTAKEICRQIYFQEQYYDTTVQTEDGCMTRIGEGKEHDCT